MAGKSSTPPTPKTTVTWTPEKEEQPSATSADLARKARRGAKPLLSGDLLGEDPLALTEL